MEKCLLCPSVKNGGGDTVQCREEGIRTIMEASLIYEDGIEEQLRQKKSVVVHKKCRKAYTRRPCRRSSEVSAKPAMKRKSSVLFDFKLQCLLCEKYVNPSHPERDPFCEVRTLEVMKTFEGSIKNRNDCWAHEVELRINTVSDLVAAEGRYHKSCLSAFLRGSPKPGSTCKQGRKEDEAKLACFNELCRNLEKNVNVNEQYTMKELFHQLNSYNPLIEHYTEATLKKKLKEKYGDGVTFTVIPGLPCTMCFTGYAHKIIHEKWYADRHSDPESENLRIIRAAAQLIRKDIKGKAYDCSVYPSVQDMKTGGQDLVPPSLNEFFKELYQMEDDGDRKPTFIQHEVVAALRPRSFMSPLLTGIGTTLHRVVGSKLILDMLHNIGVSISYKEVLKYEDSITVSAPAVVDPGAYVQVVFDNADQNVRTLHGHGTFHTMGGIMCVTPKSAVHTDSPVPRPTKKEHAQIHQAAKQKGFLPVKVYYPPEVNGYSKIIAEDVWKLTLNDSTVQGAQSLDVLWRCGLWSGASPHPGWNGFMEAAHRNEDFQVSSVVPLPFINLNATNNHSIFTALSHAVDICNKMEQKFIMVTFDQQLYCKAVPMILADADHSPLKRVIVRLGGFHLLKSFLGAIGMLMAGSGLEECLAAVYARNSVEQMVAGNAYSRAVRGHFLMQLALVTLILSTTDDDLIKAQIKNISDDLLGGKISVETARSSEVIRQISIFIEKTMDDLSSASRTCKLWVQYINMVSLIHMFLRAERSGDWNLHLVTVRRMLPYFHAAGHLNYAKSAQVYLQQMSGLQSKLPPEEFQKFVESGFFTIRRSSKFWCGIPTDMTIEQVLMRAIKSLGGLTRGRGMSDATVATWLNCAPACSSIIEAVETFCGVAIHSTDQHVDLRNSRQQQDHDDVRKFVEWLQLHHPFDRESASLVCILTGRVASEKVNADNALELGLASMTKMHGVSFADLKLRRKDSCISIAAGVSAVKVREKVVQVNPDQLFHRMLLTKRSNKELAEFLTYELKEPPPALFDGVSLREGTKSKLMSLFPALSTRQEAQRLPPRRYVVDGGYLLRQVLWLPSDTYGEICDKYSAFLQRKCKAATTVVFDGYQSSTKDAAHARRRGKGCVNVLVEENGKAIIPQAAFLTNGHNKTSLIRLLAQKLEAQGITVHKANADADRLIVTTAISYAERGEETCIIGQDTDLAVLMIALTPPSLNLHLLVPTQTGKTPSVYSSAKCQQFLGDLKEIILVIHAFTGCDTTSAIYRIGKVKLFKLLKKSAELRRLAEVFNKQTASHDELCEAGEALMSALYPGKSNKPLDQRRYELYCKINSRLPANKKFDLAQLPPTSAATRQHTFRVYHQVQEWKGFSLPPTDWGWQKEEGTFYPISTGKSVAPEKLLENISCNCISGCLSRNCSCRKHRIECTNLCGHCAGHGCGNSSSVHDDDLDDPDGDLQPNENEVDPVAESEGQ